MQIRESMNLGVLVERKKIDHPWQEYTWHVHGILQEADPNADWDLLREDSDSTIYLAKTMTLELFQRETEGYKNNLESRRGAIFVVLRPGEDEEDHDVEPFLITACPYEAADYLDSGEEIVESVTMPENIKDWVEGFVRTHHVEQKFKKRRLRKQEDGMARKASGGNA